MLWTSIALPVLAYDSLQQPILGSRPPLPQPLSGFGTWNLNLSPENTTKAVSFAIQAGYRQIDAAAIYRNEVAVGKGIADGLKKANITRQELWVTSKLWNDHHGNLALAEEALEKTLKDLGLDYLDLYLMHWPVGAVREDKKAPYDYVETWRSLTALPKNKVLNIGICNFSPAQLEKLIGETGIKPFAHQMELHPYLQQNSWLATHKTLGISVTAYSPLGNSNPIYDGRNTLPPLLKNEDVLEIAAKVGCSPAQVVLAWGIRRGTSVIPKSAHEDHIVENLEAQNCKLSAEDLAKISLIGEKHTKRFSDPSKNWGVKLFEGLEH
ncbi:NADP-dependent oxidoreductase domain-containing protein [Bisporella sp. PMI_857]|nr:NADP-dependent oxidoreductase domain-containing protein [Bisporella sp. PMI_857]